MLDLGGGGGGGGGEGLVTRYLYIYTGVLHHLLSLRRCNTTRFEYRSGNKITFSLVLLLIEGVPPPPLPPNSLPLLSYSSMVLSYVIILMYYFRSFFPPS